MMATLTQASKELFRRTPDECFPSLAALAEQCRRMQERSTERWCPPRDIGTWEEGGPLMLEASGNDIYRMTDWSFSQLCRLAGVSKDTVNRLTPRTAKEVFSETLPKGSKPMQLFTDGEWLRSIHTASYTRLYNAELLGAVEEFATDFEPPPKGANGGTGLYAGEQDLFAFLIDPGGWAEIQGEAFAPGFFLFNSEVGCRSVGISTFWFQALCKNHILYDVAEVTQFTRKHTSRVHDSLFEIRRIIESLVQKRNERRDGFVSVIEKAMETRLADDAEEAQKVLSKHGITRQLAKRAAEYAMQKGALTIFGVVDALTRFSHELRYAGDRTEADQRAASLLALAT